MAIWSINPHDNVVPPYENTDGKFKFLPTVEPGSHYTFTYQNGKEEPISIVYTVPNPYPCVVCDCNQLKPVINETNDHNYTYTYPSKNTSLLTNVPLAVISAETSINITDINVFAYDEGITSISIVESGNSIVSRELKNFITSKFSPQIFVIIGTLSETNDKRALRFGYSACGRECYNANNPLYVYQRCACGMDNCRNEYGGGNVIEDRALYIASCIDETGEQMTFSNGDSICVETLYIKKVEYYTIDLNGNASPIQTVKTYNDNDGKGIWLRKVASTPPDSVNPIYKQNHSEIKANYDFTKFLDLDTTQGHTSLYIYPLAFSTGSEIYPLGTMIQYVVGEKNEPLLQRPNYEQVWRLTYHTDSDKIIGGDDNGRCALGDFYVTLYVAPNGKKYYGEEGTHYDKKKEYKNCT